MLHRINPADYQAQLNQKITQTQAEFEPFQIELEVFPSAPRHYRMRAEFKVWHQDNRLDYAMFEPGDNRKVIKLDSYPAGSERMASLMPSLKFELEREPLLSSKLFQVDFLTATTGDAVVTLIYHRPLDTRWETAARALADAFDVGIVGRSRKQKHIIKRDWVNEAFSVGPRTFHYRQHEGAFTQPNAGINHRLLNWVTEIAGSGDMLLELYCGSGNFTLPLAQHYRQVIATEISKAAIVQAQSNCSLNEISNIEFLRISSEDFAAARSGMRPFFRLRHLPITTIDFDCALVDPPRSGLDPHTLAILAPISKIIYISCNPASLQRDLATLGATHKVTKLALFDQFPFTPHREVGVCLTAK